MADTLGFVYLQRELHGAGEPQAAVEDFEQALSAERDFEGAKALEQELQAARTEVQGS